MTERYRRNFQIRQRLLKLVLNRVTKEKGTDIRTKETLVKRGIYVLRKNPVKAGEGVGGNNGGKT